MTEQWPRFAASALIALRPVTDGTAKGLGAVVAAAADALDAEYEKRLPKVTFTETADPDLVARCEAWDAAVRAGWEHDAEAIRREERERVLEAMRNWLGHWDTRTGREFERQVRFGLFDPKGGE